MREHVVIRTSYVYPSCLTQVHMYMRSLQSVIQPRSSSTRCVQTRKPRPANRTGGGTHRVGWGAELQAVPSGPEPPPLPYPSQSIRFGRVSGARFGFLLMFLFFFFFFLLLLWRPPPSIPCFAVPRPRSPGSWRIMRNMREGFCTYPVAWTLLECLASLLPACKASQCLLAR